MDVLPAELTDLVIDKLQDDRNSLCSCSLVCKAWLPRSSAHLFKSLRAFSLIETAGRLDVWMTPFYEFCSLIATSTRVSTHIQILEMTLRTSSVADVATIVLQLPHLRSLSVSSGMTGATPPSYALPCSGRHVEHLDIEDVRADVIPYFLGLFSSVGTLKVSTCAMDSSMLPASWQRKHLVRNLRTSDITGKTFRYVTALLQPSTLESINVSLYLVRAAVKPSDFIPLLLLGAPSMRRLEVTLDKQLWVPSAALSAALEACAHLESFTVNARHSSLNRDWWRGLLAFLPALPRHVRVVRIVVCDHWTSDVEGLREIEWRAVGSALEHCAALERLQVVVSSLLSPPISVSEDTELQEAIVAALPYRLRGKVVFEQQAQITVRVAC